MIASIAYNLQNLIRFSGREARAQFWPYAAFVFILAMACFTAMMAPEIYASMHRMQRFAVEHPELATIRSSPGSYSISIRGYHPELMPNIGDIIVEMDGCLVIIVLFLAAAVARRLHDTGKSGWRGILPVLFLASGSILMPMAFALTKPDAILLSVAFLNNFLYIASLIFLIISLSGSTESDNNRYGLVEKS